MKRYAVVFIPTGTGFSAYVLGVNGLIAAGSTLDETRTLMREAMVYHFEAMKADGEELPLPIADDDVVELLEPAPYNVFTETGITKAPRP